MNDFQVEPTLPVTENRTKNALRVRKRRRRQSLKSSNKSSNKTKMAHISIGKTIREKTLFGNDTRANHLKGIKRMIVGRIKANFKAPKPEQARTCCFLAAQLKHNKKKESRSWIEWKNRKESVANGFTVNFDSSVSSTSSRWGSSARLARFKFGFGRFRPIWTLPQPIREAKQCNSKSNDFKTN